MGPSTFSVPPFFNKGDSHDKSHFPMTFKVSPTGGTVSKLWRQVWKIQQPSPAY